MTPSTLRRGSSSMTRCAPRPRRNSVVHTSSSGRGLSREGISNSRSSTPRGPARWHANTCAAAAPTGTRAIQAASASRSTSSSSRSAMCGGAIGSPQILQLSGIGAPALLASHGIAVRHALPGVGENLQDHL
ncbi:MAG: GMC family oxidoreductase N-terminal domain-containing protein, partial [Deltaproteobacteria bacterium]|nr:GMC family oxidoreductase N-terminal domain-containing protein [Deltaproteobacteria bacterium]